MNIVKPESCTISTVEVYFIGHTLSGFGLMY